MLQFLCNFQLPRCAYSVTMMPEFLLSTKVLRDSLSLGQFYKLKIPASLMTHSSAKSFNLIYKCFKVTEVPFFEAKEKKKKEQWVYQPSVSWIVWMGAEHLPSSVLKLLTISGFRLRKPNIFSKTSDLSCIYKFRLGVQEHDIYFKISISCFPCSFILMEYFKLMGSSAPFYWKCKQNNVF